MAGVAVSAQGPGLSPATGQFPAMFKGDVAQSRNGLQPASSPSAPAYATQLSLPSRADFQSSLKRIVEQRLLRLRCLVAAFNAAAGGQPAAGTAGAGNGAIQRLADQFKAVYSQPHTPVHASVILPGIPGLPIAAFSSRSQQSQLLLSEVFGLSDNNAIQSEIRAVLGRLDQDESSGQQSSGQQANDQSSGETGGRSGGQGQGGNSGRDSQQGAPDAESLKEFLLLDMAISQGAARGDTSLSAAQFETAVRRQAQLREAHSTNPQASEALAGLALAQQVQDPLVGGMADKAPRWDGHLYEVCDQLVRLYADRVFPAINALTNALEVTGRSRSHQRGPALSAALAAMRNLSVIATVFDQVEQMLTGVLLGGIEKSKLPSLDSSLQRICLSTRASDVSPLRPLWEIADLARPIQNELINSISSILRALPIPVWVSPDDRAKLLLALANEAQKFGPLMVGLPVKPASSKTGAAAPAA